MYNITVSEATSGLVDDLKERYNINTKQARELLANCLTRNLVIEEIIGMADFIMGEED